jgi:hypothetical protein
MCLRWLRAALDVFLNPLDVHWLRASGNPVRSLPRLVDASRRPLFLICMHDSSVRLRAKRVACLAENTGRRNSRATT